MPSRKPSDSYIPALTGIRAIAAMMVFFHHMAQVRLTQSFFRDGYVGVTVFFTLSGYLITRTYYEKFINGTIRFPEYWLRRVARIVPVYLLLVVTKLIWNRHEIGHLGEILAPLTLTQGFFGQFRFAGLSPGWSLTIEESFYLLAPLIFLFLAGRGLKKTGRSRRLSGPNWTHSGFKLFVVCVFFWGVGTLFPHLNLPWYFLYRQDQTDLYSIFGRMPEFAIGMLLGMHGQSAWSARPSGRRTLAEAGFVAGVAAILGSMAWLRHLADVAHTDWGIWSPSAIYCFWIAAAGAAALIWSALQGSVLCSRILGNPVMEYLGRLSFVLYLLQDRFLTDRIDQALAHYTPFHEHNGFATYIACNLVAMLFYEGFEKPVHRRILGYPWRFLAREPRGKPSLLVRG